MTIVIKNFIPLDEIKFIRKYLESSEFLPGIDNIENPTSDYPKYNFELNSLETDIIAKNLLPYFHKNKEITDFTISKNIFKLIFNKTLVGGRYGNHIDAWSDVNQRADISFSLFLSDPDEYDGGELEIEHYGKYKLNAGDIVVYPQTKIHQVCEVTRGVRYVCCGWIMSHVKNTQQREIISDCIKLSDLIRNSQPDKVNLIMKIRQNLMREWYD